MNYLSHAYQHLEDPYFVAGTSLPDWMNVVDRKNRARSQRAEVVIGAADARIGALARGVIQHHRDDQWFHQNELFVRLCSQFAIQLRQLLPEGAGHQAGFLGHIAIELLLDAVLIEQNPAYLKDYYHALERLDLSVVQLAANQICRTPFEALPALIPRFTRERFLDDYVEDSLLWRRLNHVMRRVQLPQLPDHIIMWLGEVRPTIRENAAKLLSAPQNPL